MVIAQRRSHQQSLEFADRYRWRAGIEGTMSAYDRLTGVKRLQVRGLKAVRFGATLKAVGVNLFRATDTGPGSKSRFSRFISRVREQMIAMGERHRPVFHPRCIFRPI